METMQIMKESILRTNQILSDRWRVREYDAVVVGMSGEYCHIRQGRCTPLDPPGFILVIEDLLIDIGW